MGAANLDAEDADLLAMFDDNNEDDPGFDSADEFLTIIEEGNQGKVDGDIMSEQTSTCDESSCDMLDEEKLAKIAALQAEIAKLAALPDKKKKKKKKEGDTIETSKQNVSIETDVSNNLCKHNKNKESCFFCKAFETEKSYVEKKAIMQGLDDSNRQQDSCLDYSKKKSINHIPNNKDTDKSNKKCESSFYKNTKRTAHHPKHENKEKEVIKKEPKESKISLISKANMKNTSHSDDGFNFHDIRISTPKISSSVLKSRMESRKYIKISKIHSTIRNNDIEGDWVTVGVIVKKTPQKKTANGKNFCVMQLSDLGNNTENETVGLFLFGDVNKEHWKLQIGTVVGLLNGTIMKQEKDSHNQLSITLDNAKKLMEIGTARDLAMCKGVRKADNKPCSMFINKKYSEYCEYHVQRAFKKAQSARMDLQSGGHGPSVRNNKGGRMMQMKKEISSGSVHYGGKTLFLPENKAQNKVKLSKSSVPQKGMQSVMSADIKAIAKKDLLETQQRKEEEKLKMLEGGTNEFKTLLSCPTVGSRNFMHHLKGDVDEEKETTVKQEKTEPKTAKNFLCSNKPFKKSKSKDNLESCSKKRKLCDVEFFEKDCNKDCKKTSPKSSNKKTSSLSHDSHKANKLPMLGRGFSMNTSIEFSDEEDCLSYNKYTGEEEQDSSPSLRLNFIENKKMRLNDRSSSTSIAKKRAIEKLKRSGKTIEKENPNEILGGKRKLNKSAIEERVNRSYKEQGDTDDSSSSEEKSNSKKRKSLLSGVLGKIDLNTEEGKKILNQKSRNSGALALAEAEREEKYFNMMEKKEKMEEKMSSVMEIKVSGWACKECRYLSESRSKLCIDQKHPCVKIPDIKKRFFKCKNCGTKCNSYNKLLPGKPCSKCGNDIFDRVAMATERKGPKIGGETLEVRGHEQKYALQ